MAEYEATTRYRSAKIHTRNQSYGLLRCISTEMGSILLNE